MKNEEYSNRGIRGYQRGHFSFFIFHFSLFIDYCEFGVFEHYGFDVGVVKAYAYAGIGLRGVDINNRASAKAAVHNVHAGLKL